MTPEEHRLYAWEGGMILQLHRLADVNRRLLKQLAVGRVSSEVVGAFADLRDIANRIELTSKAMPD